MSDRDESAGFLKRWMLDPRVEDAWGKFVTSIEMPMSWGRLRFDAALAVFAQKASEVYAEQELAALTAENERLTGLLTRSLDYAIHDNYCPADSGQACNCGIGQWRAEVRAALPSSRETAPPPEKTREIL